MLLKDSKPQPLPKDIKTILIAGILLACLLITIIGITTWLTLNKVSQQVETIITETNTKTNLIYDMRIAARERNMHLSLSLLSDDPFYIDDEWMQFRQQGSLFLNAREKYKKLNPGIIEMELLKKQRELSKHAVKLQYEIYDLQLSGQHKKAIKKLNEEIYTQVKVFSILDELLEFHKENYQTSIKEISNSQQITKKTIVILIVFIFSIVYLTSAYLVKKLSQQAITIKNETIKYKALIEGSMDSIIVLDKNKIIDCNTHALHLFGISSLSELNKVGLDYFSQFSDDKKSSDTEGIFGAINYALVNHKNRYFWNFKNTDDDLFPSDVELQSIEFENNNYVQMIIRDVTERENDQQALRDANKNLEKKIKERTEELEQTNVKMVSMARSAGMSEVASGVLHNVGNVLNSVNVSASILKSQTMDSRILNLKKIVIKFHENSNNIEQYLNHDDAGKLVIPYLEQLSDKLIDDQNKQVNELNDLIHNVDHIKNIISMQQSYAGNVGLIENIRASEAANDAININISSINKNNINLNKLYDDDIELSIDKHKLIQILVNLISNARHAVINGGKTEKNIIFGIKKSHENIIFYVEDNGIGINNEDLDRVFEFGFKKRADGHGYGLHHSAIVTKELGGELTVKSDGLDMGATFTLSIPITLPSN